MNPGASLRRSSDPSLTVQAPSTPATGRKACRPQPRRPAIAVATQGGQGIEKRPSPVGARQVASGDGVAGGYVLGPGFAAAPFVVATAGLESGVPVVSVTGELDLTTAPVLEEALLGVSDGGVGAVILDLAGCGFIDLRGLRVLLAARERLQRADRPLALVVGNPRLLRTFELTRVLGLFEIYPSLAAATKVNGRG